MPDDLTQVGTRWTITVDGFRTTQYGPFLAPLVELAIAEVYSDPFERLDAMAGTVRIKVRRARSSPKRTSARTAEVE